MSSLPLVIALAEYLLAMNRGMLLDITLGRLAAYFSLAA
jgi:hypothetical protein